MKQLKTIKGNSITVPKLVNRYLILYYDNIGWRAKNVVYITPESAIQDFIEMQNKYPNPNIAYYKAIEVELEIPFIPNESKSK